MLAYTPQQIGIAFTELIQLEQETKEINVNYHSEFIYVQFLKLNIRRFISLEFKDWGFEYTDGTKWDITLPEFVNQVKILLGVYKVECPACGVIHFIHPDCKIHDLQMESILCAKCEPFCVKCVRCGEYYDKRDSNLCPYCELPDDDGDAEYTVEFQIHS